MTPEARIAKLRDEVNFHLYRYHVLDDPVPFIRLSNNVHTEFVIYDGTD